jgi:hypothetical protein
MSARELVMAILCRPLSGKELLQTERDNNVIIHRQVTFEVAKNAAIIAERLQRISNYPVKLMFIFGISDVILVNSPNDMAEVTKRLLNM